ncbi:DUF4489 domain-containing protein [Clostridium sp. DSM 100503]|uniref:DUF4489 domain-containing protein n=1 Tax=Clostridium sp. DSM 100503 TaxID=2963282 RepID=UPI0021499FD5|nr:DUF4489 domain-containing protein [Clostridium sp. DSM 100503]MCR1950894.1 DUF4489 domain-containing protein [Clostridium sp. DSM 100503]
MSLVSKGSDDRFEMNHEIDSCKDKETCPTIIKCSCLSSITLPIGALVGDTFTLAALTLDTSCLCNPIIKLEFASNVVIPVSAAGAFSLRIFKQCRNQLAPIPVGPEWTFISALIATDARVGSSTLSFFICDDNSCSDECCVYTVVATVTRAVILGNININNSTLGAIATCHSNKCRKNCTK